MRCKGIGGQYWSVLSISKQKDYFLPFLCLGSDSSSNTGKIHKFGSGFKTAEIRPTNLYAIERGRLGLSKSGLGSFWSCLSSEKSALFWGVGATIDFKYKVGFNDWKMPLLRVPSHFSKFQNLCKSSSISLKFKIWDIPIKIDLGFKAFYVKLVLTMLDSLWG